MIWLLCGLFFLMINRFIYCFISTIPLSFQMRVFIIISPFLLQHCILDVLERGADQLTIRYMEKKHVSKEEKYIGHLEIQDIKLDTTLRLYFMLSHLGMD